MLCAHVAYIETKGFSEHHQQKTKQLASRDASA